MAAGRRSHEADPFADLLKYSLATSSLLSARLSDAISLYPPVELAPRPSKDGPPPADVEAEGRSGGAQRTSEAESHGTPRPRPIKWGEGWDTAGETVWDRSAVGNAWRFSKWLASPVVAFMTSPRTTLAAVVDVGAAKKDPKAATSSVHADALGSVDRFVSASQQLDLRVTRALGGIREVECITWGLGL